MNKMILRFVTVLLVTGVLSFCGTMSNEAAYGKVGDRVGSIYSTDILAYINDRPVPAYNIGGETVIVLEDLIEFGFDVTYSDPLRTLLVYTVNWRPSDVLMYATRGVPGRIVGGIYETDIITYVNGLPIRAYALNGKTAVSIEELAKKPVREHEYSPYNMHAVWDGANRTISLYFLHNNRYWLDNYEDKNIGYKVENNILHFEVGRFNAPYQFHYRNTADFQPRTSFPVYYGNQRVATGFAYQKVDVSIDRNGRHMLSESGIYYGYYFNAPLLNGIASHLPKPSTTYEEAMELFLTKTEGETLEYRIDTDHCTVLFKLMPTPPRGPRYRDAYIVLINKDGSYQRFSSDYFRIDAPNIKPRFQNIKLANNMITFNCYYGGFIIDTRNGVMRKRELPGGIIPNGTYYLESALKPNMVVDVSEVSKDAYANVHLWTNVQNDNQKLEVEHHLDGFYTFKFLHSNQMLNVQWASPESGANVIQHSLDGTVAERWLIRNAGNGYYYIVSSINGKYLDVSGANTANGTNIQVYDSNGTNAQKWRFVPVR